MKHYQITVTGKVQGVFYRDSTKNKAWEIGVNGIVRNEPDGTVYIEAEGTEEQLQELVKWCKQGPPKAKVESVDFKEGEVEGYTNFQVTYC